MVAPEAYLLYDERVMDREGGMVSKRYENITRWR
jgi:hypothetical protein